jgi:hypothetical protein
MTGEEFWKIYETEDILAIFDTAYDFFSADLPSNFSEEYDAVEVILEITGHHQDAKEFDKVLKFTKLIQEKQPVLYQESFQYLDRFLIDYYCFLGDEAAVEKSLENFLDSPDKVIDDFLVVFKKLLFCQYNDMLDKVVARTFDIIKKSVNLIGRAEYNLAIYKYYANLEKYYYNTDKEKGFAKEEFANAMLPYDFKLTENILLAIEKGLFNPDIIANIAANKFKPNENEMLTLQFRFSVEMTTKNISFPLSGRIWNNMQEFWNKDAKDKKQKSDTYFFIPTKLFEEYLVQLSGGLFVDNKVEMMATLWGSVYVYDFLFSIGIISPSVYNDFKETSNILKGLVIGIYIWHLWNAKFIHQWAKPNSISETEFEEERKIFEKSLMLKPLPFVKLQNEIEEELANIGPLSVHIIEGGKQKQADKNLILEDLWDSLDNNLNLMDKKEKTINIDDFQSPRPSPIVNSTPIRVENKVGRNDPCPCGSGKKYKKCCENK